MGRLLDLTGTFSQRVWLEFDDKAAAQRLRMCWDAVGDELRHALECDIEDAIDKEDVATMMRRLLEADDELRKALQRCLEEPTEATD
ncbi:MAG: hypothetical protein ACRDZ4_03525 [Egibacteraceae bacterium]